MESKSIKTTIEQLENLFEALNGRYFENQLSKPVITVSPDMMKGAYGWCTTYKAWKETGHETDGYYEINICAEYLSRPFEDTAGTMLHEMIHLYNLEHGIKDVSRGGTYHNKKFKEAAENHGLTVGHDSKYGWTKTALTDEAKDFVKSTFKDNFDLYRLSPVMGTRTKAKSNSIKYVCPCCGIIVRATKQVKILCYDCEELMEEEI